MNLEIVPVSSKRHLEEFLRLPERLYEDDPSWVPNLLLLQRDMFSDKRNPFFEHGEAQAFLALRDGQPAGRISAQVDRLHNEQHDERTGFFGFFECEDDERIAAALLRTAEAWLRERGMERARGPLNFSINEELGLLVEGFDEPPMIGMTHARPYYDRLVARSGYCQAVDLFAFRWQIQEPPPRTIEAADALRAMPGVTVRNISLRHLNRDVDTLLEIFNDAWQENWGFVPATRREADKIASDLRLICDTRIALIAEIDGEPAGMIVGVPNLYEAIRDFRGYLNPWNAARLVWRLKLRGLETGRIMLFGVKKKFSGRREYVGLPYLLLHELYLGSQQGRYRVAEESWVLESNRRLAALMRYWGAEVYKRYRVYEKVL